MKAIYIFFMLVISIAIPSLSAAKPPTLIVSGAIGWEPYLQYTENNSPSGALYDILMLAAHNSGAELEFVHYPWKRILKNTTSQKIDIICGIFYTDERADFLDYSAPVVKDYIVIFVRDPFPMEGLDDLKGKRGDCLLGGSLGEEFDNYAKTNLTIHRTSSARNSLQRLLRGYTDYYVSAYIDGMNQLIKNGWEKQIQALPYLVDTVNVYYAFSKNPEKQQLYTRIKQNIATMISDGTVNKVMAGYFPGYRDFLPGTK